MLVADLRVLGLKLDRVVVGEREVGGGLRNPKADVSEASETDGLKLAVEIKPVHLAVGRAIWNRFGDVRTFAVNLHLKFPFAVVGGILTLPTTERLLSGNDGLWKPTTHLVTRAVGRFVRAGGRRTEGDAGHLLEGIAVVAFDRETGAVETDLPPVESGLRWTEFVETIAEAYQRSLRRDVTVSHEYGVSTTSSTLSNEQRKPYSFESAPQAASAIQSGSSYPFWSESTVTVIVKR